MRSTKTKKSEKKLRESLERNRGSMKGWSAAPTPAKVARGGGIVFSVRFTSEELKSIRRRASVLNTNVSGLIRRAVLEESAHQPARVYSVSVTNGPTFCSFGTLTNGYVVQGGTTVVLNPAGAQYINHWKQDWVCSPEQTYINPIAPKDRILIPEDRVEPNAPTQPFAL
jgi:hypothetical protein